MHVAFELGSYSGPEKCSLVFVLVTEFGDSPCIVSVFESLLTKTVNFSISRGPNNFQVRNIT
jgi:hypothetical protein